MGDRDANWGMVHTNSVVVCSGVSVQLDPSVPENWPSPPQNRCHCVHKPVGLFYIDVSVVYGYERLLYETYIANLTLRLTYTKGTCTTMSKDALKIPKTRA